MSIKVLLATIISALTLLCLGASSVHAEGGYASPRFQIRPAMMECIDVSNPPNLYDRTKDTFDCIGPVGTTAVSGILYQYVPVRRAFWFPVGPVNFTCVPINGPYDYRWYGYTNLSCKGGSV